MRSLFAAHAPAYWAKGLSVIPLQTASKQPSLGLKNWTGYCDNSSSNRSVTVADAVAAWLETKRGVVRPITFSSYEFEIGYIVGPLLPSEARRAIVRSGVGARPKAKPIELLGRVKIQELTTRRIRAWHKLISEEVSTYSANKALIKLKAALALAAEDHEFRPPAMPIGLQRQRDKARKTVLTPDEVARLLAAARDDLDRGVYVAFPFLAGRGRRSSWPAVGRLRLRGNLIRIERIQFVTAGSPRSPRRRPVGAIFLCRGCCARCCSPGAFAARERTASSIACSLPLAPGTPGLCRARAAAGRSSTTTSASGSGLRC